MFDTCCRIDSMQKNKVHPCTRSTALSLMISGLFSISVPTWAACVVSDTPNEKEGVNIVCEGKNISQNINLLGDQSNNNVTVQGDTTTLSEIYGGLSKGAVTGNSVTLKDNSSVDFIIGGFGEGTTGDVTGNSVVLNDSSQGYFIIGGFGLNTGDVIGNSVTMNAVSSASEVSGGRSNGTGDVVGNSVTMNNMSRVDDVYGGFGESTGDVIGNSVILNNNSHATNIYGGYGSKTGEVTENSVTLKDNSSVANVYGGYSNGTGAATGNTINIHDSANISDSLYGGFIKDSSNDYDVFTGNTLNFSAAPITLSGKIANIEYYNFTIDPSLANTDIALITANTIVFGDAGNSSKIEVVGIKSGNELFVDDKFVLMQTTETGTMSGEVDGLASTGVAQQGISLLYDIETAVDNNKIIATIVGKEDGSASYVNPQLKSLSEGHLSSSMILNRGADHLVYSTMDNIQQQNLVKGFTPFITLSGGKTRYNSGSHIDAKDGFLTGGVGYNTENTTSAVIIENGWGSYNTYNSFDTMKDVKGSGHNHYVGAAILGRYNIDSGMHIDGSLRAGKNHNKYESQDIQNLDTGEYANYKLNSNYLGAHIGGGYSKVLNEKNTMGVSAKYLWGLLKGKTVNVAADNIHFNDIDSHRIRFDTDLSHHYTEAVAVRAGLGYEYEFDNKANASTYGYDITAPGVKGSTTILTLGSTVNLLATKQLYADINLNGYTGKRDGVGGGMKFSYVF